MAGCCGGSCSLDPLQARQRTTLRRVLWINAVMFLVIAAAAISARSTALLADSLDNLGDAFTYAISLYAVGRGTAVKARVALVKGGLILLGALAVVGQILYRIVVEPAMPQYDVMGTFAVVGLAANLACLWLLTRHRHDDINMSSVWECSRNDIVSNLSVLAGAFAVSLTDSRWPDLAIAAGLAFFLFRSAMRVVWTAREELRIAKRDV
ncbi:MAG TPA: cation transporter [Thiotrichales bacterium]|nr:cation transporter [Thiotrichales bacterium]